MKNNNLIYIGAGFLVLAVVFAKWRKTVEGQSFFEPGGIEVPNSVGSTFVTNPTENNYNTSYGVDFNLSAVNSLTQQYIPLFGFVGAAAVGG